MTWLVIVVMTCIVFLNFIIAEVSSSYGNVKEDLNGLIQRERATLIKESEDMLPKMKKSDMKLFPKYLISREIDN